jgi:hypothetical protein
MKIPLYIHIYFLISIFERLKKMKIYHFFNIKKNLNESTHILKSKSKLIELHVLLKQTPKNIKINSFNMCCSFVVCKYKYLIYFGPICNYNILHIIYDPKKKSITLRLHFIIKNFITNNINVNIKFKS